MSTIFDEFTEVDDWHVTAEPRMPSGWRRWSTDRLEALLDKLPDDTFAWDDVITEIQARRSGR